MEKEFFEQAIEARFLKRVNRFTADICLADGSVVQAHVANTGRMQELLVPDVPCLIRPAANKNRKTAWDLLAVSYHARWVCLVASWANDFMTRWIESGCIPDFDHCTQISREVKFGHSRFDLMLEQDGAQWVFEVKSVNFCPQGHALFPDAPTMRGVRHVQELMQLREAGWNVGVFFVTMGQDVVDVRFNDKNDPLFAQTMRHAMETGLMARAFEAKIEPPQVIFSGERPICTEEVR